MSKAIRLASKARATRQYLQTLRRLQKLNRAFHCEHGHFGCAAEPEGACIDELMHLIGAADGGAWPYFSKFDQRFVVRRHRLTR